MRMVKTICMIGLMSTGVMAASVSPEQAMVAVENWRRSDAQLNCRLGERPVAVRSCRHDGITAYHVVSMEGGGFVVTSADTGVQPIILFSSNEDLSDDDLSPLRALLAKDRRLQPSKLGHGAASVKGSSAASAKWARLLNSSGNRPSAKLKGNGSASVSDLRVAPLVASQWSQASARNAYGDTDLCFNYYTPENLYCGCVATAGAQIMRYFQYPTAPVASRTHECGVLTNYVESGGYVYFSESDFKKVSLTTFGGTYDWSSMPLLPAEEELTEAQRQAIGKLTYDISVLCRARYSEFGTSASGYYLGWLFQNVFGFANALPVVNSAGSGIANNVLKRALIPNLENGLPVEIGFTEDGYNGHSVLIDGYGYSDGDFYVHVNMGWAGQNDAWYEPDDVDVDEYWYTVIDELVCNIYPTGEANLTLFSGRTLALGEATAVSNVTIVVTNTTTMTQAGMTSSNEKGIYGFKLPPGEYMIYASYDDVSATRSLTLGECQATTVSADGTFNALPKAVVANQYDINLMLDMSGYYATLHFDVNGGGGLVADQNVLKNHAAGSLPTPAREGYWFDGWFTAPIDGTRVDAETTFAENCTLYAHWKLAAASDPGVWTVDVAAAKNGAAANNGIILVLRANYATCGYTQALQPLLEDDEFLNWAHANNVYLVTSDGSRLPAGASDSGAATNYFNTLYFSLSLSGVIEYPSIAVAMGSNVNQAVAIDVVRNGRQVGGVTYNGTIESLKECLAHYLPGGEPPSPPPDDTPDTPPSPPPDDTPDVPSGDDPVVPPSTESLYPAGDGSMFTASAACTYNGWVYDDGRIVGTVTFKVGKVSRTGQSKVTVAYTPIATGRKVNSKIVVTAGGQPEVNLGGDLGVVRFAGNSIEGPKVQAGVDQSKSKDRLVKATALSRLQRQAKVWTFALETEKGYAAYSVTIDKKGKGKLAGTLPDGTKVSISAQGALGAEELAIPFIYSKKGRIGFVFRVKDGGAAQIRQLNGIRLASGLELDGTLKASPALAVDSALTAGTHTLRAQTDPNLVKDFTVVGKKWNFVRDGNAVKLTFTPKTGAVKGSFKDDDGVKFNVTGEVVGGVFYGTAVNKQVGSFKIEAE